MKKKLLFEYIAILLLFTLSGGGTFENPAVQTIINAWPGYSSSTVMMLITLPSLVSMITMLIVGKFVGHSIKYRTVIIIGTICAVVGGVGPFFIHTSWVLILVCRFLLGVGVGCYSVRNALIVKSVPPQQLAKYIGLGNVVGSFTSTIAAPIVGTLASISWYSVFLVNGIALVAGVIAIVFMKEPAVEIHEEETKQKEKVHISKTIWMLVIIQFFATMTLYPLLSGISLYLSDLNLGNATIAGYMISIYTCSGIITNLALPYMQRLFKNHLVWLCFMLPMSGVLLVLFGGHIIIITLGVFISGIGFTIIFSLFQVLNGIFSQPSSVAMTSTIILAANQLGVFLSSYFIEFSQYLGIFKVGMRNPYFLCFVTYLLIMIFMLYKRKELEYNKDTA